MAANTGKRPGKPALSEAEKAKRKEALKNENKGDKFRRIGQMRVPKALSALKGLANLANYDYTPEQRDKILKALQGAVQHVHAAFSGEKSAGEKFTL